MHTGKMVYLTSDSRLKARHSMHVPASDYMLKDLHSVHMGKYMVK